MHTQNISHELIEYVESYILPQYKDFDKAHRQDHILSVIEQSMSLAKHYDVDAEMVYVIAAYHDLGMAEGREFHHISSGRLLTEDKNLEQWFDAMQIEQMREAIEDHRASSKNEPRTIYGRIVAEADRVIDPTTIIRRTIQYGLKNHPELNRDEQYQRFVDHLNEKYNYGGYLKLLLPESSNAPKLEALRVIISNKVELQRLFDEIYREESK